MSYQDDDVIMNSVTRYQKRLENYDDINVVMKTLKKLNNLEMNFDILRITKVGKTVNSLKKNVPDPQCRSFVEEIIKKWKSLVPQEKQKKKKNKQPSPDGSNHHHQPGDSYQKPDDSYQQPDVNGGSAYDPSGNWQMTKNEDDEEEVKNSRGGYDPTQNWSSSSNKKSSSMAEYSTEKSHHKKKHSKLTEYEPSSNHVDSYEPSTDQYKPSSNQYQPSNHHVNQSLESKKKKKKKKPAPYEPQQPEEYQPSNGVSANNSSDEHTYEPYNGSYKPSSTKTTAYDPSSAYSNHYNPASEDEYSPSASNGVSQYKPSVSKDTLSYKPSSGSSGNKETPYKPSSGSDNKETPYKPSSNGSSAHKHKKHKKPSSKYAEYEPAATTTTSKQQKSAPYHPMTSSNDVSDDGGYQPYKPSSNKKEPSNHRYKPAAGNKYQMSSSEDEGEDDGGGYDISNHDVTEQYSPTVKGSSGSSVSRSIPDYSPAKMNTTTPVMVEDDRKDSRVKKIKQEKQVKRKPTSHHAEEATQAPPSKKQKTTTTTENNVVTNNKKINKKPALTFEQFCAMPVVKKKKKKRPVNVDKLKTSPSKSKPDADNNGSRISSFDIKMELPEIKKIYQPLPALPYIKRKEPSITTSTSVDDGVLTDQAAAELHTQRNNQRMKIYVGGGNTVPKVYRLYDICIDYLRNHINYLDRINIPFEIIHPVLEKCNPDQLFRIESYNEEFVDETHSLWKKHVRNEFKNERRKEMQSYRELYWELRHRRDQKLEFLKTAIRKKTERAKPLEKRTKMAFVGFGEAKAPRNVKRAQIKNGTGGTPQMIRNMTSAVAESQSASGMKKAASMIRHKTNWSVPSGQITASNSGEYRGTGGVRAVVPYRSSTKKPGKAPLMMKTLKSMRGHRR